MNALRWPKGGLAVPVPSAAPASLFAETAITDEAALGPGVEVDLRVEMLAAEDDRVAQGAPLLRLRRHPEVVLTAPMPCRVAEIDLAPGRRLASVRLFHEPDAGRHEHDTAGTDRDGAATRALLLGAGLWTAFRERPFGHAPAPSAQPAAIVVMALDTRPHAPDPRDAVHDREEDLARGLSALTRLTEGPVLLCQDTGPPILEGAIDRVQVVRCAPIHPWGLAGFQIHHRCPAAPGRPVWDIHAEDVAGIGALLATGLVPETRHVAVAGDAMTAARFVRCQPGADLRSLAWAHVKPGPHRILSGSALDGREARWLGTRDRQVSVLSAAPPRREMHWFLTALTRAARPLPLIPTAAVDQALGGALPAMPFLRALAAGDAETVTRLGGLSLLPEDLALADYVTGAEPRLSACLATLLGRIEAETAP